MWLVAAAHLLGPMDLGPMKHDTVTVEHLSEKPCCGSGVIAFYVDLTVRTPRNKQLILSMAYLSEEQPFPQVGDLCHVGYRRDPSELHADGKPRLVVWEISCSGEDGVWREY